MNYRNIIAMIFAVAALISLSSCDPRDDILPRVGSIFAPKNLYLRDLPQGNDSYSVGFRDGCDTFMGTQGTSILQFKGFHEDNLRAVEDQMYSEGYEDGINHCTYIFHPAVN